MIHSYGMKKMCHDDKAVITWLQKCSMGAGCGGAKIKCEATLRWVFVRLGCLSFHFTEAIAKTALPTFGACHFEFAVMFIRSGKQLPIIG
jgi:hypothetical protein